MHTNLGTLNHCNFLVFGTYQHNVNCFKLATTRGTNNVLSLISKKYFFDRVVIDLSFYLEYLKKVVLFFLIYCVTLNTCRIVRRRRIITFLIRCNVLYPNLRKTRHDFGAMAPTPTSVLLCNILQFLVKS